MKILRAGACIVCRLKKNNNSTLIYWQCNLFLMEQHIFSFLFIFFLFAIYSIFYSNFICFNRKEKYFRLKDADEDEPVMTEFKE